LAIVSGIYWGLSVRNFIQIHSDLDLTTTPALSVNPVKLLLF